MNILITPSKAVKAWIENYIKVDFHYTRLNETIFSMIAGSALGLACFSFFGLDG